MRINKDKFSDIENAFDRLRSNESDIAALRSMSDSLTSLLSENKSITVKTVRPESLNQECTVMSIYPDDSTINALVDSIVNENNDGILAKIWNNSNVWNMEIDTRILSPKVGLTSKELTALTLHEIGHIIYSNTIPMKLSRVVRFKIAKTGFVSKQLLKDNFFSKLIAFPIIHACKMNKHKASIKAELKADQYSINAGYGEYLSSAMNKIIIYAGENDDLDDELESLSGFSIDTLTQLQNREYKVVKRNMAKMISSTPSTVAKRFLGKFNTALSGNTQSSVTESVAENYIESKINTIIDNFYASEAFFNRVHKLKRIDPLDIDYIGLEVNDIKSNDDKMMIVSYIYNKLDIIDYYIAIIESKNPKYIVPHSKESLLQMRERLNKYRLDAINKKLPSIQYGVNIMYPTGFEG